VGVDDQWLQWEWRDLFLDLRDYDGDDGADAVVFPFLRR
jgi:hypothetical protein